MELWLYIKSAHSFWLQKIKPMRKCLKVSYRGLGSNNLAPLTAFKKTPTSESGFIGQVSLHKQGIWLGKVALSVLTQNIHPNTKQYKQCNGLRSLKKVYTRRIAYIQELWIVTEQQCKEVESPRSAGINIRSYAYDGYTVRVKEINMIAGVIVQWLL